MGTISGRSEEFMRQRRYNRRKDRPNMGTTQGRTEPQGITETIPKRTATPLKRRKP